MAASDCRYLATHEWARKEDEFYAIGISHVAVRELSDLVFVDLPEVGRSVSKGEAFGEVESVKAVSDLLCPLSGEIVAVNADLPDQLEQLSQDPYGQGWLIKVKTDGDGEFEELLAHAEYTELVAEDEH